MTGDNTPFYEIRVHDIFNGGKDSVFYRGYYSFLELSEVLYNEGLELDEQETLEIYLDHDWLENHIIEVVNTFEIMDTPIHDLLKEYQIYKMVY